MTKEKIRAIQKRRGNLFTDEYIIQFEEKWNDVVALIGKRKADLSRIALVAKPKGK